MIRKQLRKFPTIYSTVRKIHVKFNKVRYFNKRKSICLKYKNVLEEFERTRKVIWYFCVPIHNNLGDYAQKLCIEEYLSCNFNDYQVVEIPTSPICYDYCDFFDILKKTIEPDDIIVFQSGYTSTDLHDDELVHRLIAKTFVTNKIVFFPQTVRYTTSKEAQKTANVYNNHGRILFMARDKVSYETAKQYFTSIKVVLVPDIVTTLIGTKKFYEEKKGILFCIRNDSEKHYSNTELRNCFKDIITSCDEWSDTSISNGEKCNKQLLLDKLQQFARHKAVVTDRFHGTIFSLIASTPVVVMRTADHKVSEGADWFTTVYPCYIRKTDSLQDAYYACKDLLNMQYNAIEEPLFKQKYYDKLLQEINEL